MKEYLKKVSQFWKENQKVIYIVGGTTLVVVISGKIGYKIGFLNGYKRAWVAYQEGYLKDIVPEAYKLVMEHIANHPEEYIEVTL